VVTIRDVARKAGVSVGTVSNVLNRPSYVNAATKAKVEKAISALGFAPTGTARQYRAGRERTLGLALADMGNPFFVDIALGAEAMAKELGVGMVICHNGEDPGREEQNLDLLAQLRVQGIMITPVDEQNARLGQLKEIGLPIVHVDRVSSGLPCCWLATDDHRGGRLAGEHLADVGSRRPAFVGSLKISRQVQDRYQGFVDGFSSAAPAGSAIELIDATAWTMEAGREVGRTLAARRASDRPDALFCANDLLALGLLAELQLHGIEVPRDIGLIGFDDLVWAEAAVVPLTSIRQPRTLLGRIAVSMLIDEIDEGPDHVHRHQVLQPELIIRRSTVPAGGSSPRRRPARRKA
jgi:LacI family transcriptional regulator